LLARPKQLRDINGKENKAKSLQKKPDQAQNEKELITKKQCKELQIMLTNMQDSLETVQIKLLQTKHYVNDLEQSDNSSATR
jgi:hypothetical protein